MLARTEEHRAFMRPKFPVAFELFYAVIQGTVNEVRARIAAGDDPNARSADGATPISLALRFSRNLPKAELLYGAGARLDSCDALGMQPIHWGAGSCNYDDTTCLHWLLDRGADPDAAVRVVSDRQYHPVGWTPLHVAAAQGFLGATRLLIEHQADVNAKAADGRTPLHVAAGCWRVYKRLMRTLIDAGADADAVDSTQRTALHVLAAGHGRYRKSAVELLRHRRARLDLRDTEGRLPVDVVRDGLPATAAIRELLTRAPEKRQPRPEKT